MADETMEVVMLEPPPMRFTYHRGAGASCRFAEQAYGTHYCSSRCGEGKFTTTGLTYNANSTFQQRLHCYDIYCFKCAILICQESWH
jgi:hypothetical protein